MFLAVRCWTASKSNCLAYCRLHGQSTWKYDKNFKACQGVRIGAYLLLTAQTYQASTVFQLRIVSRHLASNDNPDSSAIVYLYAVLNR